MNAAYFPLPTLSPLNVSVSYFSVHHPGLVVMSFLCLPGKVANKGDRNLSQNELGSKQIQL